MAMLAEVTKGLKQFGRTGNPTNGPVNPMGEAIWLAREAVRADKLLTGREHVGPVVTAQMYLQRLREMGSIFAEIFALQEYSWKPKKESPRVIDLGGDIGGFAVLYWKSIAPSARITLVEANPATASVVTEDFRRKGLEDVEVINAAISSEDGTTELYLSGYNPSNSIGRRGQGGKALETTVTVPSMKLSTLIGNEHIDLLKMDIEGAEGAALRDLEKEGKLGQIDEIMMEFHNDPANPTNSLPEVIQTLTNAGFRIENPHVSSIDRIRRLRRIEPVDIAAIKPNDRIFFSFTAKKS